MKNTSFSLSLLLFLILSLWGQAIYAKKNEYNHILGKGTIDNQDSLLKKNQSDSVSFLTKDSAYIRPESTVSKREQKQIKTQYPKQVRIGLDLSRFAFNAMNTNSNSFEAQADYALRNNFLSVEAGFGKGNYSYSHLDYKSNSTFIRFGVDKPLLEKSHEQDYDLFFVGVRYGAGFGNRGKASYTIVNIFGDPILGFVPAQSFFAHWGELTLGVKVEMWQNLYAGWNFRAKFLLNASSFDQLAPNFIAGYGAADRTTNFDFNFYVAYGIKWKKRSDKNDHI